MVFVTLLMDSDIMIKRYLIILFFIQLAALSNAQSFVYSYATPDDEMIWDVIQDSSANYYMVGMRGTYSGQWNSTYSSLLIKLNSAGDTLKTALIPPPVDGWAELNQVLQISDTTFAAFGCKQLQGENHYRVWYVKFDRDLNVLTEKIIGDTAYSASAQHVHKSLNNEFLVIGSTGVFGGNISFYRLSPEGDSLQSFLIGDTIMPGKNGMDILELPDTSGYLIFASGFQPNTSLQQILRVNNSGSVDTIFEVGVYSSFSRFANAVWLSDTTFATNASAFDPFDLSSFVDLRFSRFDLNFNIISDTLLGPPDTINREPYTGIDVRSPYVFGGGMVNDYGFFFEPHPAYYYAVKFNMNMEIQWEKIISHSDDFLNLYSVKATSDGGVILAGTRYNSQTSGSNERDIYVVKLDSLGNFTTGINNPAAAQVHEIIVYPNPAHDVIHINSTSNFTATAFLLFDASGRKVMEKKFSKSGSFSVSQLGAGIYFYKIKDAKGNEVWGKVVKE
jgi:type IX secretion system substrate protein